MILLYLYRYALPMSYVLQQVVEETEPSIHISLGFVELAIGFIIGFSPILFNALKERTKWGDERKVVQSEAVENLAQAASMLAEQSQNLTSKNATLIQLYEDALQRQVEMTEHERALRVAQSDEIEELKKQIKTLNEGMVACSREMLFLVRDIIDGKEITKERLDALEEVWHKTI